LHEPVGAGPHPLVLLGHGFGGSYAARLEAYCRRFAAAGIAAFAFDYRYFGQSSGEPRQLLSIARRHEDWRAAIAFARALKGIDPGRVALWGTSLGGGDVVAIAADDPRIAAVVSQTPFADGWAELRAIGVIATLRLALAGVRDQARAVLGRPPYRLPVVAAPGETGAMTQAGSYEGYMALFEQGEEFRNEYCARVGLTIGGYSPIRAASRVTCPLLVITCAGDLVTPPGPARAMGERAPDGRVIEYEGDWGHFDIYVGELFERTIADQIDFLSVQLEVR
jgi:pimeloyl-ACP methyl ester carboxylesterase